MNERHLFVWVSVTVFDVWSAVHDGHPPSRAPVLPEEITTVWLAAMAAPGDVPVWRAARGEPWTLVERAADA